MVRHRFHIGMATEMIVVCQFGKSGNQKPAHRVWIGEQAAADMINGGPLERFQGGKSSGGIKRAFRHVCAPFCVA